MRMYDPDDYIREAVEIVFPTLAELRAQGVIGATMPAPTGAAWPSCSPATATSTPSLLAGRYTAARFRRHRATTAALRGAWHQRPPTAVPNGGFLSIPRSKVPSPTTSPATRAPVHERSTCAATPAKRIGKPIMAVLRSSSSMGQSGRTGAGDRRLIGDARHRGRRPLRAGASPTVREISCHGSELLPEGTPCATPWLWPARAIRSPTISEYAQRDPRGEPEAPRGYTIPRSGHSAGYALG